jgi:sporulation protein YlmC with PRC-barrel domain
VKPDGALKLLAEVRDLQIVDKDGRNCGICDDIELEGGPGKALRIKALLVGPGAYEGRVPTWLFWLIERIAGSRMTRVPWSAVDKISARIFLNVTGEEVGLRKVEDRWVRKLQKVPTS